MKKTFTKQYLIDNRGCYELSQVEALLCINNESITLNDLFDELTIRDFCWWLVRKCDLTEGQKVSFAVHCAEQVLPIYEAKFPNDFRLRECLEATKKFQSGEITKEELEAKRRVAAYHACSTSLVASAVICAAYASTANNKVAAHHYIHYAHQAAAIASNANNKVAYKQSIWEFVLNLK